jgi:hypothetical protein
MELEKNSRAKLFNTSNMNYTSLDDVGVMITGFNR